MIAEMWNSPDGEKFATDVFEKYKRLMLSTARKYTPNISDQEDIVQTALERLIKIFTNSPPPERCVSAAYITYTVKSVAIDFLRKQKKEAAHCISLEEDYLEEIPEPGITLDDSLVLSEEASRLKSVLAQLPARDSILLQGKYIFGLTDKDLAIILQCKPDSIRMKLTRARQRAMKLLREREGER